MNHDYVYYHPDTAARRRVFCPLHPVLFLAFEQMKMNPLEKLVLARAILEHPDNWTQGTYARDEDGYPRLEDHPDAVCWCMSGACRLASADAGFLTREVLKFFSVPTFNDSPRTTHEQVLSIFDRAIAKLL